MQRGLKVVEEGGGCLLMESLNAKRIESLFTISMTMFLAGLVSMQRGLKASKRTRSLGPTSSRLNAKRIESVALAIGALVVGVMSQCKED
jgi:hypothetical protein